MYSFLVMYYVLHQIYFQRKENDLGGFLGMISPELWVDGRPADYAVFDDWRNFFRKGVADAPQYSDIYGFLELYENEFNFDFSLTKKQLLNNSEHNMLKNAHEWAHQFCLEHENWEQ